MSQDLHSITSGWDYQPGRVMARWISGDDGRPRLQLRLDLGVLQLEPEGRPDGARPRGCASRLEYHLRQERDGAEAPPLSVEDLSALQQEALQYYYRYMAYSALRNREAVLRDTRHNLDIFELVGRRAADPQLVWNVLQFFPFVRMMHARAQAEVHMDGKRYSEAVAAIEEGLEDLRAFSAEHGIETGPEQLQELEQFHERLLHLRDRQPLPPREHLQAELARAIETENYERAAALRDQLKDLGLSAP